MIRSQFEGPYANRARILCRRRASIITKKGYIGHAPEKAKRGDIVCVFRDAAVPFVLEIFPTLSKVTKLKDFALMGEQQETHTQNPKTRSLDWREWYNIGQKCSMFALCFDLMPGGDSIYHLWLLACC
jgi:hypothetical protein